MHKPTHTTAVEPLDKTAETDLRAKAAMVEARIRRAATAEEREEAMRELRDLKTRMRHGSMTK